MDAACEAFRPELILREPCEYASAVAAEARGIPHVTVAISKAQAEWSCDRARRGVLPGRGRRRAARRVPYLSRFPASLDPSPFPDTRRYAEEAPAPESTRELVYATFGTEAAGHGYDPYRALLDAVDGLDVPVLLTTGDDLDLGPVPPNVRVERWVPQLEALAKASLVVCHGGSGTVLGTLAAGIPLIILPMFADQTANARTLAEAGAARIVAPRGAARRDPRSPAAAARARARAARRPAAAHSAASSSLSSARRRASLAGPSAASMRPSISPTTSRTIAKTSLPRAVVRTSLARPSAGSGTRSR